MNTTRERLRQMDAMRLFKENMKFLDRLRTSKGTIDTGKFKDFEE